MAELVQTTLLRISQSWCQRPLFFPLLCFVTSSPVLACEGAGAGLRHLELEVESFSCLFLFCLRGAFGEDTYGSVVGITWDMRHASDTAWSNARFSQPTPNPRPLYLAVCTYSWVAEGPASAACRCLEPRGTSSARRLWVFLAGGACSSALTVALSCPTFFWPPLSFWLSELTPMFKSYR